MTDDLHQDDYSIIEDALNEFDLWIRTETGADPARGRDGEWHNGIFNGQQTKERRYGHGKKINATLLFDNRSPKTGVLCPNGWIKIHGEEGARKWSYKQTDRWQRLNEARAPVTLSPAELAAIAERDRLAKEKARKEAEAAAAENAAIWKADLDAYLNDSTAITAASTGIGVEYLTRKRVAATPFLRLTAHPRSVTYRDGWRQSFPAGSLIIPLFDVLTGKITAFQWITKPTGKDNKSFRRGAKLSNIVHWIGSPKNAEVVALAEGYATAWTFHDLTGIPTGSTCDAGQLKKTAAALLRSESFTGSIIIAADDDFITAIKPGQHNTGSRAASGIKELAPHRVFVLKPPFDRTAVLHSGQTASDWNDFYVWYGDAARPTAAALRDMATAFFKNQR